MLLENGPTAPARSDSRPWWIVALALPGFASLAMFAARHLPSTGFWYDESMQFWMSLGLDGVGPPRSPPGGFWAAIHHNAVANLDPGGFTLILRYWLRLGTGEMWQRILPFLFFATGLAGVGWIGWAQRRRRLFAAACCAVPALFPLVLDYATEVRAYSMEFAGVVLGCALLERFEARPAARTAVLAGTTIGFFLTSRYGFAIFAIAACLSVVVSAVRDRGAGSQVGRRHLFAFFVPVGLAGAAVAIFALWPQYQARMSYEGGVLIGYLAGVTTASKSIGEIAGMLAVNLLHPAGLPVTAAATLGAVTLLPQRLQTRLGLDPLARAIDHAGLAPFGLLCLIALAVTALLWRWHPWAITTKWSLWLQALSAVALVRLAAGLLANIEAVRSGAAVRDRAIAALTLIGVLALDLRLAFYQRPDWPTFVPALAYLERLAPPPDSVAMDVHSYPTIRYFYEYGAFTSSPLYPDRFRMPYWNGPRPLIGPQTRFLLTGLTLSAANRVFAPATITRDVSLPERLFRVDPPAIDQPHD
ncbi:MAG: hypothetical protein P4M07_11475 [Xanthobacteraceae bacterium]|nr:hypothetical protein [Xanthobacteraceae bacterium]